MTSVASSLQAESQAGGLPVVSDRVRVLEGIAVNLQTAVTTLQSNVTTLKTSVTNLQTNVTTLQTKVTTLESDNTDLQSALDAEIAARKAAEAQLQDALNLEEFFRKGTDVILNNAVATLKARLDSVGTFYSVHNSGGGLDHGIFAEVAILGPLPPGNYLVIGT